jgi:ssDNA-binding Zn-finger/Zn-ribbon topoisomerase 1
VQHNISNCNHIWEPTPYSLLNMGCGCPECNSSHGERRVKKFFKDNNIKFIREFTFPDCKNINSLEFDFAIFDDNDKLSFLVEYDGELHYKVARWSKDKKKMEKKLKDCQLRDAIKNEYCKNNNIPLLRIPYWDFENIEDILSNYLHAQF